MTRIYLDSANLGEIDEILKWGIVDGITTNQKIFLKEKGCNFDKQVRTICNMARGCPISIEGPNDITELVQFVRQYENIDNVVFKVPMLTDGRSLGIVHRLSKTRMRTNVTACMTVNQVFLAMSAGADYVSMFFNRMVDNIIEEEFDVSVDNALVETVNIAREKALHTIECAQNLIRKSNSSTKLIIGSIRSSSDITDLLCVTPDIITIPYNILKEMPKNYMTDRTLKEFEDAWQEFKEAENANNS